MAHEFWITGKPDADALLANDPFALLLGMLLDQQITMEAAFAGPHKLATRMGGLDVRRIAEADPDGFESLATTPPAIHRYGRSMAGRVQALARALVADYDGDVRRIWTDPVAPGTSMPGGPPDADVVLRRLRALPGFGDQKARIFLALLGKQFDVRPAGWRQAAGVYGEDGSRRSIADVTNPESLAEVRAAKQAAKAAARRASE